MFFFMRCWVNVHPAVQNLIDNRYMIVIFIRELIRKSEKQETCELTVIIFLEYGRTAYLFRHLNQCH